MRPGAEARQGARRLELVVVLTLVAALAAVAGARLRVLRAEAERAAVGQVVGALRAAVSFEVLGRVVAESRGGPAAPPLAGSNPMALLEEAPRGYRGVLDGPDPAAIPRGAWVFDRERGRVLYRPRYPQTSQEAQESQLLAWRIVGAGTGVRLEAVDPSEAAACASPPCSGRAAAAEISARTLTSDGP